MDKDPNDARRAAAERRVRDHDEQRMQRLLQFQQQSREMDEEAQTGTLDQIRMREEQLKEERREAVRLQEERLQRDLQKLSPQARQAPVFGMGVPAQNSVQEQYRKIRMAHERQHDEMLSGYERHLKALKADRLDLTERHTRHNERRDAWQAQKRDELAKQQERTFEARTEKEMTRPDQSLNRTFSRSRDGGRER